MSIEKSFQNFYSQLQAAGQKLKSDSKEIGDRQIQICTCIQGLPAHFAHPEALQGSEIKELCKNRVTLYEKQLDIWKKRIDKYVKKQEFVKLFEKSVLLIVFADVKAGKSTLGNFVSGYYLQNTPFAHLYRQPQFFRYEQSGQNRVIPHLNLSVFPNPVGQYLSTFIVGTLFQHPEK